MKTITFILPSPGAKPAGGYKVVYEYANRLAADGHNVNIVYAGSLFWRKKTPYYKLTNCVRYLQSLVNGYSCRKWFQLDKKVREVLALSLNYRHVPESDIYVATSPYTAMYVKDYPLGADSRFYFIQDYEAWGNVTDEMVKETYHYPMRKIAISTWLHDMICERGEECRLIPNGFDFNYFKYSTPFAAKDKYRITMLYHQMERKGCQYSFAALDIVKKKYPALRVNIFGTPGRPDSLPEWYDYHCCPDPKTHNALYDQAAIFISSSLNEGWGLTVGEAMICGQAVACTDNPGHREMAVDGQTALLSPVRDSARMAENIISLIEDDQLRYRIAARGHQFIKRFSWDTSYAELSEAFGLNR